MAQRLWVMMLAVSAFQLSLTVAGHATTDSWVKLVYPLTDLQEEGTNCEASTMVLDPVSSGPHATARLIAGALPNPIIVPNPIGHPGAIADANAISDGSKAAVVVSFVVEDDGSAVARGKFGLDASALSAANGISAEGRADTLRRVKQLAAFALRNFLRRHEKAAIAVAFDGLPTQDGLPGVKLPVALQSPVSAASPWLAELSRELKPDPKCPSS